jgi:dTDP-4-dehydrorhamnose 3,5-epimerase
MSIANNQAENSQGDGGMAGLPDNRPSGAGYLIVGSKGQLGLALQTKYPKAAAVDSDVLDITDKSAVDSFDWQGIKYIINAAGYTNVDGAETEEGKKLAWAVNGQGVANLSSVATLKDMVLVHISTEYVFDGSKAEHKEDEVPSPLSEYGKSKAAGDVHATKVPKHYLVRTSWVIGQGKNFVRTMLNLAEKGISPTVVSDQIGRPTFTAALADAIGHLITPSSHLPSPTSHLPYGTYNVSGGGQPASWADVAREVFQAAGYDLQVTDTTTEQYYAGKQNVAPRPLQSTLDLAKIRSTGFSPPDWHQDLVQYVKKEIK